jgi:hypothetical protein
MNAGFSGLSLFGPSGVLLGMAILPGNDIGVGVPDSGEGEGTIVKINKADITFGVGAVNESVGLCISMYTPVPQSLAGLNPVRIFQLTGCSQVYGHGTGKQVPCRFSKQYEPPWRNKCLLS